MWLHYLAAVATRCGSPDSDCKRWSWTHPNVSKTDETGDNLCWAEWWRVMLQIVCLNRWPPIYSTLRLLWLCERVDLSKPQKACWAYDWPFGFVVRWILTVERKRMRKMSSFPPVLLSNMSRVATPVHSFTDAAMTRLPCCRGAWHLQKSHRSEFGCCDIGGNFPCPQQACHSKSFHFAGRFTV